MHAVFTNYKQIPNAQFKFCQEDINLSQFAQRDCPSGSSRYLIIKKWMLKSLQALLQKAQIVPELPDIAMIYAKITEGEFYIHTCTCKSHMS